MKRRFITLSDGLIAAVLILAALAVMFFGRPSETDRLTAEIICDGQIQTVDLWKVSEAYDLEIISNGHTLILTVTENGILVKDSTCNDRVCVNTGMLDSHGDCAVCLPGRVTVRVYGSEDGGEVDVIL